MSRVGKIVVKGNKYTSGETLNASVVTSKIVSLVIGISMTGVIRSVVTSKIVNSDSVSVVSVVGIGVLMSSDVSSVRVTTANSIEGSEA